MNKRVQLKILIYLLLTCFIIGAFLFLAFEQKIERVQAGTEHNVSGWAFSENIGWISFNSTTGGGSVNYGVNVDSSTGIFSGYAWSRGTDADVGGVGWISFADFDGDGDIDAADKNISGSPCAPNCEAKLDLVTGEVSGWARALAYGGGWDGWIKLRGSNYGVKLNSSTREFEGWAWGGDDSDSTAVIGWLSFNHLNCDSNNDGVSDQGNYSQCPTGQPVADYKVKASLNLPPTAENLNVEPKNYCNPPPAQEFSWMFSDPDGDNQSAYRLQVDTTGDWVIGSGEFDSGKAYASCGDGERFYKLVLVTPDSVLNKLDYNTHYYWRLRVWDENDTPSADWIYGPEFDTEKHMYPYPDFSPFPPSPTEGEVVQLCATQEEGICPENVSSCYDINNNEISCSGKPFLWTLPSGALFVNGASQTTENPRVKFTSPGDKQVSLQITDDVGSCTRTKAIGVILPLPRWREVAP